jgi:beta-phosphoglucomutase
MFKAVIFDLDGVILDSMPFHVRSWKEAFARYGYKVRAKDLYLNEGAVEADGAEHLKEADRTFSSWKSLEGFLLTR